MKKPLYIKIPGHQLTSDQFEAVARCLLPKFGPKLPSDTYTQDYWFSPDGKKFLGVFQ